MQHCEECGIWRRRCEFFARGVGSGRGRRCLTCRNRTLRRNDAARRPANYLPAEPIQELIRETGQAKAARIMEVTDRRVYAILRQRFVRLDTADRWCLAFGLHLSEVYP